MSTTPDELLRALIAAQLDAILESGVYKLTCAKTKKPAGQKSCLEWKEDGTSLPNLCETCALAKKVEEAWEQAFAPPPSREEIKERIRQGSRANHTLDEERR